MPPNAKSHIITATPDGNGTRRVPVHLTITCQSSSRQSGTTIASASVRRRRVQRNTEGCFASRAAGFAVAAAVEDSATGTGRVKLCSRCCNGFHKTCIDESRIVRQLADLLLGQHLRPVIIRL